MRKKARCESAFVYHRRANKPDDSLYVEDVVPIFPTKERSVAKCYFTHDYHREIAWATDVRGDFDERPALVFIGAGYTLVLKVMMLLFGKSSPLFSGFRLYREATMFRRNGKASERVVVEFSGYRHAMMSADALGLAVCNRMQAECWCRTRQVKLNKLLNM